MGDVTVEDIDLLRGTYVDLLSLSDTSISLAGWSLSVSDGETETTYKLPRG